MINNSLLFLFFMGDAKYDFKEYFARKNIRKTPFIRHISDEF